MMAISKLPTLTVKDSGPEHFNVLAHIHQQAFEPQGERGWASQEFKQLLSTPIVASKISICENIPLGFILYSQTIDEAEILTLAVLPEERSKGVGYILLDTTAKALKEKGCRLIHLEVRADNTNAISLYNRYGFQKKGVRKAYFNTVKGIKIDALIFTLLLND